LSRSFLVSLSAQRRSTRLVSPLSPSFALSPRVPPRLPYSRTPPPPSPIDRHEMLITNVNGEKPEMRTGREPSSSMTPTRTCSSDSLASPADSHRGSRSGSSRFRRFFDASLAEKDDVLLLPLCEIYFELSIMMSSWNYVFQMAVVDLQKKVERIRAAVAAHPEKYRSTRSAAEHERATGHFLRNTGVTQIIFSLHRTMRFTIAFLDGVRRADASVEYPSLLPQSSLSLEMSTVAREAYLASVARHHNWPTRKMAGVVMGGLPARSDLMSSILKQDGNGVSESQFLEGFLKRAEILRDRCDSILGKE
ncbi:hypothetical protein PMAYCL1PPCAC_19816, partial [Pristionchus mayeri]